MAQGRCPSDQLADKWSQQYARPLIKCDLYTHIFAVQKYASFLLGQSVDNDLNLGTHPGQTVGSALVSLCVSPCMNMCVCAFISLSETVWPLDWGQGELYSLFCAGTGFPVVNTTERFPGLPNPHTQTHTVLTMSVRHPGCMSDLFGLFHTPTCTNTY